MSHDPESVPVQPHAAESPEQPRQAGDPPSEPATDPARAWGGVPFASRAGSPAASAAGSVRSRNSASSAARRARAEQQFNAEYANAYDELMKGALEDFAREQEAKRNAMEDELKYEDDASEAQSRAMDPPDLSALDAEPEVLKRRMDDLRDQYARYERLFRTKTGSPGPPLAGLSHAPPGRTQVDGVFSSYRLNSRSALPSIKIKVDKPKPWQGKFDWAARETWVRTASLYLASIGVRLDDTLDELETPEAFYIIRGFFSTDASSDGVSPQRWFDALNDRVPFPTPRSVFAALKAHWADDAAAETALERYRSVKQGSLKARDFGAKVDSLANACMDRVVDELDRKTTFLAGLNSDVKDFTRVELARREELSARLKAKKRRKRKRCRPSARPPIISPEPLTLTARFEDEEDGVVLIDSGSQADVISPRLIHLLGLEVRRLDAPIHAALASDQEGVRLSLFTSATIAVGSIKLDDRAFFVSPLPPGVDALLGTPWLAETSTAVSSTSLFYAPAGLPSSAVYDFSTKTFLPQPARNLADLGFSDTPMTDGDLSRFVVCALKAGVPIEEFDGLDDRIDLEPHNSLLDIEDQQDPDNDLSADDARAELDELLANYHDVFVDELPGLPPFRPVNHSIDLADADKVVRPRAIRIPDRYAAQWTAHVRKFISSGFWAPAALESACSLFSVPKHDRTQARFVINLRPRNENTVKKASPIPDMKQVRYRLASHPYRSKLDFKNAYEQVRLESESVPLSGFVTSSGTFVSRVMQQGDCNAPDTMHRVCFLMFQKAIGRFLDVFYDDVFVYSQTRRDHLRHLNIIFDSLRHYKFYLSRAKVEFFTTRVEALGVMIDDDGLHAVDEKWDAVKRWPTPRSAKDVLKFMGTIGWMSDHLPRINEIAAPLTRLTGKVDFVWSPACELAFTTLKSLIPQALKPLDLAKIDTGDERLFLVTDASIYGCGGWLGQGEDLNTARPFRFFSSKFNSAQRNYTTTDQELLGVFTGIRKMHEHVLGTHFTVCCDHEPLKTYWSQPPKQTRRHIRLWETLSQYDFDWLFTPGKTNVLADALSRIAEVDPDLALPPAVEPVPADDDDVPFPTEPSGRGQMVLAAFISALTPRTEPASGPLEAESAPPAPLVSSELSAWVTSFSPAFAASLAKATSVDPYYVKIAPTLDTNPSFALVDGALYNLKGDDWRLVMPTGRVDSSALDDPAGVAPSFVELACRQAHLAVGHQGFRKTRAFAHKLFWWATMDRDVQRYCDSCEPCARGKTSSMKPLGLLHPLPTPRRPWEQVGMDFVVALPKLLHGGFVVDCVLTVTDYLSKFVVLIPLSSTATAPQVAELFFSQVVRRFGLPANIVSDRDPKFRSSFWRALASRAGIGLKMSTSAHPQTDGQAESTNRSVGQILRILCEDSPDDWLSQLVACELALNASISASTNLAPFEVVHGFVPPLSLSFGGAPSSDVGAEGFAELARLNALRATDAIIGARVRMTHQENRHRRDDAGVFAVGDKVYVSSSLVKFPPALASKFLPKYIGPYLITDVNRATSTYTVDFPPHIRIHKRIHASRLRPHLANDDDLFPSRAFISPPPVGVGDDPTNDEYLVERIVGDKVVNGRLKYNVRWLGWSAAHDDWLDAAELAKSAQETIDAYEAIKLARRPAARAKAAVRSSCNSQDEVGVE
ncbi:hypothetical protein JCM3770_006594 [Rhodotorula araucariae]